MYAVVAVGGNQHRVEEGSTLLVDRMGEKEGAKVALTPVMFRGDDVVVDSDGLKKVKIEAVVKGHERGEKIRVFKFKPKRGYKRTTGHRQELTRLEVTKISFGGAVAKAKPAADTKAEAKPAAAKASAKPAAKADTKAEAKVETKPATAAKPAAKKPAAKKPAAKAAADKPATKTPAAKKPAAKKPAEDKE
jgi:large subunit ribosomal protein L21